MGTIRTVTEALIRLVKREIHEGAVLALATAIAGPIEQEIARKEISSLLLTKHTLPKGERPIYQKKPTVRAHWISKEGEAREQEVGKDEVEFPTHRIHSAPMVDISILKHGNIGTLTDIQTSASDEIHKGSAEKGNDPVNRFPAERRSHGWRRPGFFAKQDSGAKKSTNGR